MREEVFPRFEKKYGTPVASYQIESGRLEMKLEALLAAGASEIDLFAQDNMNLAALVNKELIADLSEYRERIPDPVITNLIEACSFDGRLYFMPFRPNVQIVYYNREVFSRHGLSVPRSWDQLFSVAKALREKEGRGGVVFKAYGGDPTATQVYEFVLQAGGDPYMFNDDGCVRAFEFLRKLGPYFSPESRRAKWDTVNEILAKREGYLAANWPFGVRILIKEYGLEFIDTYSGWKGPAGEFHVVGGDVFGIPVNAKNRERALDFIFFMQTKEVQEILVSRLGWPSVRTDAYAEVEEWQRPHFDAVQEALEKGRFRKNVTWWPAYNRYVNRAFRDIVFEGEEARQTLDMYREKLEEEKSLYR